MTGLALMLSEVPNDIADEYPERVYERERRQEIQFHWWQAPTLIPVVWNGQFQVLRWGNKDRRGRLPYGGWIALSQIEAGALAHVRPEEVVIPANLGHHRGVWFMVEEGFRGVILPSVPGGPVVYLLVEPATNYYRNMTEQSDTMPALVNQVI